MHQSTDSQFVVNKLFLIDNLSMSCHKCNIFGDLQASRFIGKKNSHWSMKFIGNAYSFTNYLKLSILSVENVLLTAYFMVV